MINLNDTLKDIHNNLDNYFLENQPINISNYQATNKQEYNYVLDIEACPNNDNDGVITYSIALMSCDNESNICYKYNNIDDVLKMLLTAKTQIINIYVHNLFYDIKPFIIRFIEKYGNNPVPTETYSVKEYDPYNKLYKMSKYIKEEKPKNIQPFQYSMFIKKGQLYGCTLYGEKVSTFNKQKAPIEIRFFDTVKIVPFSLQKVCDKFLNLQLPKDGLDYDKVRSVDDKLTHEEKVYIYNDVFGLSHLVKKLVINGFEVNGKRIKYTKLTNSSQSLHDYKLTLLEDFENNRNAFSNSDFNFHVYHKLEQVHFWRIKEDDKEKRINRIFDSIYPSLGHFTDGWLRHAYFGGLCTVDRKNVEKFSCRRKKHGIVLDVNSLYPYHMEYANNLYPYGDPFYNKKPYKFMPEDYKKELPLYVQEIEIFDMKLKKGKMAFVQVKDRLDFNGRDVLEENINKNGEKVHITLRLASPLFELLFENYDIKGYRLGDHMAFRGTTKLFKSYLDFWRNVKENSTGIEREVAKLRQNALYGKFGSSGDNFITNVEINDHTFNLTYNHDGYLCSTIYLPVAIFVTSYSKAYLVNAINSNRSNFMYCDTDSLHLFGSINDVKDLKIDSKEYGSWKHEMTFNDFKYIGAKRYAEYDIDKNKWDIKCCGLPSETQEKLTDIEVFDICKYSKKELEQLKLYSDKNDLYYYLDKNKTKRIKGLIKTRKAKLVKNGTLIQDTPYMITNNAFYL